MFVATANSAAICEDLFDPPTKHSPDESLAPHKPATLKIIESEIKNSKSASDFFMKELRAQSDAIKAKAKNKTIELDFLCLGAGPQCAAASLVLGRTKLTSMVLEKTDSVAKTFSLKDFFINTVELAALTMHAFPGGVGSLANHTSQKYAFSSQLASHIQAQQYASNIPVLFGTTLVSAKTIKVGSEEIVEVTTDTGIVIRTKNLILGTGLGEIGTKVRDEKYRAAFAHALKLHEQNPDQLFPIMATDTFLIAVKNAKANGKELTVPKEIVIVGDGDGAKICIEGLASLNLPVGLKITWIGNTYSTPKEYLEGSGRERYVQFIVPFYERGQITGVPGHAQSWEVMPGGQMRLITADKDTGAKYIADGQMIIDSTGYDNSVPGILRSLGAQPDMVDILGPLREMNLESTVLGRQAVDTDGNPIPVVAIGAAAGQLGTRAELATAQNKNPVAIFNSVSRTSALISKLVNMLPLESRRGVRAARETLLPAAEIIREAKSHRERQLNSLPRPTK